MVEIGFRHKLAFGNYHRVLTKTIKLEALYKEYGM